MFGNIGGPELFLILLIVIVFFGPKKLPEIMKGLGQGIREFRKAARDVQEEIQKEVKQLDDKSEKKWLRIRQLLGALYDRVSVSIYYRLFFYGDGEGSNN